MEYEELKSLWDKYDNKLDNLERLNKKLITETLIKKPKKKLNWFIFQSLYGLIVIPILLVFIFYKSLHNSNIDILFILGTILLIALVVYIIYVQIKSFLALKSIDLQNDSIIDAAKKVSNFKDIIVRRQKSDLILFPITAIAVIMLFWKTFHFDNNTILIMIGYTVFVFLLGRKQTKLISNRIESLNRDIMDLKEYKE